MPRVKVARKSTAIDMTAMCDVAFLLLTFFILTAKPKVEDPSKAEVPASTNQKALPEDNLGTISIGQGNKIFYSMTGNDTRGETLKAMGRNTTLHLHLMRYLNFQQRKFLVFQWRK